MTCGSEGFSIVPPDDPNTISRHLLVTHRNSFEVSCLMKHFKAYFDKNLDFLSYLTPEYDIPLDKSYLPKGTLPIWIEKDESVYLEDSEVLKFIKEYIIPSDNDSVLVVHDTKTMGKRSGCIIKECSKIDWIAINKGLIHGTEADFVVIYEFDPLPEEISRARKGLIFVTNFIGYVLTAIYLYALYVLNMYHSTL